jgi:hypothetical protein
MAREDTGPHHTSSGASPSSVETRRRATPRLRPTACRRSRLTAPPSSSRLQGSGAPLNSARDSRTRTIPSEPARRRRGRLPGASVVPIGARGARGRRAEARLTRLLAGEDVATAPQHPRTRSIPSAVSAGKTDLANCFRLGAVAGYACRQRIVQRACGPEFLHPYFCTGLPATRQFTHSHSRPGGRPKRKLCLTKARTLRLLRDFRNGPKVLLRMNQGSTTTRQRPLAPSAPPWNLRPSGSRDVARHTVRGGCSAYPSASVRHSWTLGPSMDVCRSRRSCDAAPSHGVARRAAGCDQSRIAGRTTETYARGALGP